MKKLLSALAILLFCCCGMQQQKNTDWNMVYKCDKEGNALTGSKQALVEAIRKGASVKIGWGFKGKKHRIEHLSEPIWLAILDEKEVIAHLDPQVLSSTDWEELTASYKDTTQLVYEWRVVISTKGEFDAIWYDRDKHELSRRFPQNHPISWFIKDMDENAEASPLFSE